MQNNTNHKEPSFLAILRNQNTKRGRLSLYIAGGMLALAVINLLFGPNITRNPLVFMCSIAVVVIFMTFAQCEHKLYCTLRKYKKRDVK